MTLEAQLSKYVTKYIQDNHDIDVQSFEFQLTRKEFKGDLTLVVFPLLRHIKTNPVQLGEQIGEYLSKHSSLVSEFNVVKGFLNLSLTESYFKDLVVSMSQDENFGFRKATPTSQKVMVEYSSPNTNKPLHLGHIRNNLLGFSVAEIQKAAGKHVYKTQIINDRGIHICKSMLAWQKFGEEETPESSGLKGDHLVGKYYVKFDKAYKSEIENLLKEGKTEEEAKKQAPILLEAQNMLQKWEAGDLEVVKLWKTMNKWVYEGFETTYTNLGVNFDKNYYESDTYILGKDHIKTGLETGVFFTKDDGSVWIDLSNEGLDEKIVLRSDGTSVYMTQDIGTAIQRVTDYDIDEMIYTVGNEQDYHFKVLFLILKKLGFEWAEHLYHLSYGMVDLPSGKMKSREGKVVDADDLIEEMTSTARSISQELGKLEGYDDDEKNRLYKMIGLGALKYYILKVDPKKRILFDPKESVDFQGNTGPFIQYTYARIQSILRKGKKESKDLNLSSYEFNSKEKSLIKILNQFPELIQQAAEQYSPALIANYVYDLVKEFNSFYQNVSILGADEEHQIEFRVELSRLVGEVIKKSFKVLGIEVPNQM
ncbi:arginyl-tRNA synthetase ArgS [Psychroflexus torquis ATCC 700755]|uniref:Arginine--tRNA ligase n=1 Tax=Psychroflexus torquis (strain ATCC 700755 / CIP 106069 / ACAM 623) TaxID=313595 RepID=K4IH92_PSYTT|nr:arginine--tRNA ligase [Psychroflexus torquis]AFU69902.1 arginyl-tRNA synthetase ArgS [Psychroflexus torquis ATCC 700755]